MSNQPTKITVVATINAPIEKVWKDYNTPESVKEWNNASPDWHTPKATNDFREGGEFCYTMAAKDGSFSFDFGGVYDKIVENQLVEYTIGDGRKVIVMFSDNGSSTDVETIFEAEDQNPVEMQQQGWQAILNNFKAYAEKSL
ncbi:SRPBCC family protein [Emticicia sp. C21]|uniref:SRPBCC family protein n=1 Tax=Emticicia sp. C21 TaxID=2302915 RepID=UPI000E3471EC|nr:SRPBCC family protein [Emticicia sp. C21]RFS17868.1 polyketide cyclase [Emticicia sp. C21]